MRCRDEIMADIAEPSVIAEHGSPDSDFGYMLVVVDDGSTPW